MTTLSEVIACSACSIERKAPAKKSGGVRLPTRWIRVRGDVYCPKCKDRRWAVRAMSFSIAVPAEDAAEWRQAIKTAWAESTAAANWIATELYARDYRRKPEDEKLAKMQPVYLYPELRKRFPSIPSTCVPALEQEITRRYAARRYDLLWTSSRSLETYRYPYPFPIPAAAWSVSRDDDGGWWIHLPLPGRRWKIRLITSKRTYQLRFLQRIMAGEAVQAAAAIYRRIDYSMDKPRVATMVKLVARVPKSPERESASGVLRLKTSSDFFWVADKNGLGDPWILHGQHVRGWIEQAARYRRIMLDDLKAERRSPHDRRRGMVAKMGQRAERDRNRLLSWRHEAARMLVEYAIRQGVATIEYDDSDKSYLSSYPWAAQRDVLRQKCEMAGIAIVIHSSDEGPPESAGSLAESL